MAIIKRIKTLKGAGILADRGAKDQAPDFLRFNLVYGFNGSGKSTLSRVFACLEVGKHHEALPEECSFDIEMDDATSFSAPKKLTGLENRVCVFNTDFIERNLQWGVGRANSIFYISQEQADLAAELKAAQASVPPGEAAKKAQSDVVKATDKALKTYRTERAKVVAGALHSASRRYEAGQLQADYEKLPHGPELVLAEEALKALINVAQLSAPPPTLEEIKIDVAAIQTLIESARHFGEVSIGQVVLAELEKHPSMVPWMKEGHDYHALNSLETCLMCGSVLTEARKDKLAAALNDKIASLLVDLEITRTQASNLLEAALGLQGRWPKPIELDLSLQADYAKASNAIAENFGNIQTHLKEAERVVFARLTQPTNAVAHALPTTAALQKSSEALVGSVALANALISQHNTATEDFVKRQDNARESIRKHYISEGKSDYASLEISYSDALAAAQKIDQDNADIQEKIRDLNAKVKSHGPAAEQITKLVRAYLGHGELTIVAAVEGYELHRHGKLVRGQPSEGEKTAIALCYFLSTLESEGRSLKDLIVVIDDPISSLDTKAMNYACALVRNRLAEAAQVFVLTHNQHCMNEFKKNWRNLSKNEDGKSAKATLLFMDVKAPAATGLRTATIVEMPAQLRGHDSEYHFLCYKMLQLEATGEGHSEYWFMVPNVIRRVLEIFLAFKVPGSHPISQKLDTLAKKLPNFDKARIVALERLTQVESHSDSLEDLIAHSSMTVEETRDANAAMLALMFAADDDHAKAIRTQCKAA
ncbi:AAA family ATPase [Caulobacter sp.]|uniref:AAA family ATPase n=1 Tax=Caulobacter sp. TaxID=78 RepID=UPI001B19F503|nr:AAA family ATPase [Caulobacter sp.]MBO9543341.1 AAA family ATPase [Caulobacter sp.]